MINRAEVKPEHKSTTRGSGYVRLEYDVKLTVARVMVSVEP